MQTPVCGLACTCKVFASCKHLTRAVVCKLSFLDAVNVVTAPDPEMTCLPCQVQPVNETQSACPRGDEHPKPNHGGLRGDPEPKRMFAIEHDATMAIISKDIVEHLGGKGVGEGSTDTSSDSEKSVTDNDSESMDDPETMAMVVSDSMGSTWRGSDEECSGEMTPESDKCTIETKMAQKPKPNLKHQTQKCIVMTSLTMHR